MTWTANPFFTPTRKQVTAMSKVKICLDAGHIGSTYNQSPVVKTYYESTMAWKLHLKLKAALEQRGFEVVTTRAAIDTPMDVYARGAAARAVMCFSPCTPTPAIPKTSIILLFTALTII